ncbi:unnamed protein product [Nesidiocoris tenuis]|uniref:Uncharacterized protein n=1 Tax=Nesidiocoris tenuis TaxID=355587 RepID=A0A6H5GD59_9HEMI|nr:unnamed protein product [Nesidiocoris tenuis]CAA9999558.1 unnamed protein product [Nesidiocoris tenuis]
METLPRGLYNYFNDLKCVLLVSVKKKTKLYYRQIKETMKIGRFAKHKLGVISVFLAQFFRKVGQLHFFLPCIDDK